MGYALIDVLIRPRRRRAALHNAFVCVRELQNVYCDQAAQYVLLCLSRTRADIALAPVVFMARRKTWRRPPRRSNSTPCAPPATCTRGLTQATCVHLDAKDSYRG